MQNDIDLEIIIIVIFLLKMVIHGNRDDIEKIIQVCGIESDLVLNDIMYRVKQNGIE